MCPILNIRFVIGIAFGWITSKIFGRFIIIIISPLGSLIYPWNARTYRNDAVIAVIIEQFSRWTFTLAVVAHVGRASAALCFRRIICTARCACVFYTSLSVRSNVIINAARGDNTYPGAGITTGGGRVRRFPVVTIYD